MLIRFTCCPPPCHWGLLCSEYALLCVYGIWDGWWFPAFRGAEHRGRGRADERPGNVKPAGFIRLLRDAWPFMRPQRWLLLFGLVLMAINRAGGLVLPLSTRYLVDNVIMKKQVGLLVPLVLAVLTATAVQGITSFTLTQLLSKAAQRMIADLSPPAYRSMSGVFRSRFTIAQDRCASFRASWSDVEGLRNLIGTGLVDFVGSGLTGVYALIFLLHYSAFMTGVVFVIIVIFAFGLSKAIGTIRPIFRARAKINAEVTGRLTESLAGVRVVKGYHAEGREEEVFAGGVQRLLDNVLKTLTATSVMSLSSTLLFGIVSAFIMYLGATRILANTMTLGIFVRTYVAFLALLIAPVSQIVSIGTQLTEGMAGLERTRDILNENREDADPQRTVAIGTVRGEVAFENVSFAYSEGKPVLHEVSFLANTGTVTALVGPSGAGKSTIIGLIAAFHVPTTGRVLVDEIDLATVRLNSYRTQLGVVLQETFLFDGSIRENVAFSRPDATEDDVLAACRIARVDEFAETFAEKYETVVGERGVKLSGGQRQRISIARAILADPRILILDEATSSLDSESEALIQEGLSYLICAGGRRSSSAHRLSTIRQKGPNPGY